MTNQKKSRKILIIATALTAFALAAVIAVYATAILGTFTGGHVTVVQITGQVTYGNDNNPSGTWSSTLQTVSGNSWYTRLEIAGGYTGSATVTFQLQEQNGATWQNTGTPVTTGTISLTGSAQNIYASSDGANSGNKDWSTDASSGGTYQIVATVNSAP